MQKESAHAAGSVSDDLIASVGTQLRTCRMFISDEMVKSVANGASIRHVGNLLAVKNGVLHGVNVLGTGMENKSTSEYMGGLD